MLRTYALILALITLPAFSPAQQDCPLFKLAYTIPSIESGGQMRENSGIVVSRLNPEILWGHNDGPDIGRFLAYSTQGKFLGSYILDETEYRDMEDISCGPGPKPGVNYLYLGHTGNNAKSNKKYSIQRVEEPAIDLASIPDDPEKAPRVTLSGVEQFFFTYPDGPHDCEAMMVDPITGDIFLASKSGGKGFGPGRAGIYRIPAGELKDGAVIEAEYIATVTNSVHPKQPLLFNGGDISADGKRIVIKNMVEIFIWPRDPATETVSDVFKKYPQAPCNQTFGFDNSSGAKNPKFEGFDENDPAFKAILGEAIGFTLDGTGFYTLREGKAAHINFFTEGEVPATSQAASQPNASMP